MEVLNYLQLTNILKNNIERSQQHLFVFFNHSTITMLPIAHRLRTLRAELQLFFFLGGILFLGVFEVPLVGKKNKIVFLVSWKCEPMFSNTKKVSVFACARVCAIVTRLHCLLLRYHPLTGTLWTRCGASWPLRSWCRTGKRPWRTWPAWGRLSITM